MRNWATFESAIGAPSASNYSFTSSASNAPPPSISPRGRTTTAAHFSTPATPSAAAQPSASLFSPPALSRPASSARPALSPFPQASAGAAYASSYAPPATYASSVPPSTPASARPSSFLGGSTPLPATPLPFSTYSTFPSLSGRKDAAAYIDPALSAAAAATRTTPYNTRVALNGAATPTQPSDAGVRYMRSLAGQGGLGGTRKAALFGASMSGALSSGVLTGVYASVQALLHASAVYAQYIVWKTLERQTKLTAFLCYYCPLLLLLLCLLAFHLSHHSSLLVFLCALSLTVSHSVRSLLSAHVLTTARPLRSAWQRLLVPLVSSEDVVVACATLLCSVVTCVALSWLSSPRASADVSGGDYTRQLLMFTLCGASAFEVWWLFHHLPLPLRPVATSSLVDVRFVLRSCVQPALSMSVASAARVVLVCFALFSVSRLLLCVTLGACASMMSGWWSLPATLLRLFRIVFVLRVCSVLSYRLLALFLSRSSHFPLSYLLLALYDHYDSLSRYLSFSFLASFLASPSNRSSLLVPLTAILPDVRPSAAASAPAATAVDAVVAAALHTVQQWAEARRRAVLEVARAVQAEAATERAEAAVMSRQQLFGWWLQRARELGRLLLWQELEQEAAEAAGELDGADVVACAASILASLLGTLDSDRQRLMDAYVPHALGALTDLVDACAAAGNASGMGGLRKAAEESMARAALGLRSRLQELELPAKYRERVERTLRQLS